MADQLLLNQPYSGGAVTASGTPDTHVNVASGYALVAGSAVFFPGTVLTPAAADATYDRIDLVAVAGGGSAYIVAGTAQLGAVYPPLTSDPVEASVYILNQGLANYTGTITPDVIADLRDFTELRAPANSMAFTFVAGALSNADPGAGCLGFDTTDMTTMVKLFLNYKSPTWGQVPGAYMSILTWLMSGATPAIFRLWSRKAPNKIMRVLVTGVTNHSVSGQPIYADLDTKVLAFTDVDIGPTSPTHIPLSTDAFDTIMEYEGPVIPTATNGSASLGGDVTMTSANTAYDGPTTGTIGVAGQTFLIVANVTILGVAGAAKTTVKLWDGTTVYAALVPGGASY